MNAAPSGMPLSNTSGVSPHTQQLVDDEVRRIVDGCYDDALRILGENRERLEALTRALLSGAT